MTDKDEATFFVAEGSQAAGIDHDVPEMGVVQSEQGADQDFYNDAVGDQDYRVRVFLDEFFYEQHGTAADVVEGLAAREYDGLGVFRPCNEEGIIFFLNLRYGESLPLPEVQIVEPIRDLNLEIIMTGDGFSGIQRPF
jgi:hypothetical protein